MESVMNRQTAATLNYIWINLTSKCNHRCRYCYDSGHVNAEITLEVYRKILSLVKDANLKGVIFIGGEPTLHSRFLDLQRLCTDTIIPPVIITNGSRFIDADFCEAVVRNGVSRVLFSVLGPNAELQDQVTLRNGSFDRVIRGVETLKKHTPVSRIGTITTITSVNRHHLTRVIDLGINLGLRQTIFNLCTPSIVATKTGMALSPKEYAEAIQEVYVYAKARNHAIEIGTNAAKCIFDEELSAEMIAKKVIRTGPCQLYRGTGVQFLSDGSITPCTHVYDQILGNPIEMGLSLDEFVDWLNTGTPRQFRDNMWRYPTESCKECSKWGECTGGCPLMWSIHDPHIYLHQIPTSN